LFLASENTDFDPTGIISNVGSKYHPRTLDRRLCHRQSTWCGMNRRDLITGAAAAVVAVPAAAQTIIAGDRACPLFGRHKWIFDRNEPRNEPPPGWWWEFSKCKVCTADMHFCGEPTSDGDAVAEYVRVWYEANRETWFDRHAPFGINRKNGCALADEFILSLIGEVRRVNDECERQTKGLPR
jgi:hypothetical protein